MNIDLSKKLCDATLGEFIAAERSAAILASWVLGGSADALMKEILRLP